MYGEILSNYTSIAWQTRAQGGGTLQNPPPTLGAALRLTKKTKKKYAEQTYNGQTNEHKQKQTETAMTTDIAGGYLAEPASPKWLGGYLTGPASQTDMAGGVLCRTHLPTCYCCGKQRKKNTKKN